MFPYIAINIYVLIIGAWFTFFRSRLNTGCLIEKGKIRFLSLFEATLLLVATIALIGLRGGFTADYRAYYQLFTEIGQQSFVELFTSDNYVEVGYRILNKLISLIISDGNWALFWMSALLVVLVAKAGFRYSYSFWLFLLFWISCGFYYLSFNMFRQALAGAVLFAGTQYLVDKKIVNYIIVVLIAASIHVTALFMVIMIPLLLQRITISNILRTIALGVFVLLFADVIVGFIQQYRYEGYEYGMGNGRITAVVVPLFLMGFIIWACIDKYIDIRDETNRVFINATVIHGIICLGILRIEQISRLGYFFSTYTLLLCSNCICSIDDNRLRRVIKLCAVALLTAYVYVWLSGTGYENYYTFLEAAL